MQIRLSQEIQSFFQRCLDNAMNDYKNDFLGITIAKENEYEIQCAMKEAGFAEFSGEETSWPSLFIDTSTYLKSPYQSSIKLDGINSGDFHFTMEKMPANQLFHVGSVVFDSQRELNDWMRLRALDQSYDAAVLWQNDDVWMLDSPSEANTIDPYAQKAFGNVVTFGLGIGYFIFMAMRNPNVTSITVIEQSEAVIEMFKKYLLPQFPSNISIHIVQGDAFAYFNESYLNQFDYVFVDIWKSNEDGFFCISKMLEQYQPPLDKVDFWIEDSCFEHLPTTVFLYFQAMVHGNDISHEDPYFDYTLQKVAAYLENIDVSIDCVDTLKYYMYDKKILREIAGTKINED